MRKLQILIASLLIAGVLISETRTFELPDISDTFNTLKNKLFSSAGDEMEDEINDIIKTKSRSKRQDPGIGDESTEVTTARSSTLPMMPNNNKAINFRYMPTLSNGHIAFNPFDDGIYMNGLFNGAGGNSHRAKIPALIMSKVNMSSDYQEEKAMRKYNFDSAHGVFMETIDAEFAYIEHRLYVHQKYTHLFVCDIYAKRKMEVQGGGTIHFKFPLENHTADIQFLAKQEYYGNWRAEGKTREQERSGSNTHDVHVFWTLPVPSISIKKSEENETFVMTIARNRADAQDEFDTALRILFDNPDGGGAYRLLQEHMSAWQNVWAQGHLELEGDITTAKIAQFAQYYILSNLPALDPYLPPPKTEYLWGPGRGSLARGSDGKDKRGHVFWDNEVYILPSILLFHPGQAKKMLRYRSALQHAAAAEAESRGEKGYRFPWESAYSGYDVTPDNTCVGCKDRQIHTGAAISLAIRQYFSITRDRDYVTNPDYNGCDITREIAKFYAEKAEYNYDDGRYHLNNVMGPDDYHDGVNNNAYTNAAASLAIHWARYFACMCDRDERTEVPDEYVQKALFLKLPFDNVGRVHDQFDGYSDLPENNKTVKQADTILLGYPLNFNMSRDIQKNDLETYEFIHDEMGEGAGLTYSFMTIGWKFVNDFTNRNAYYLKSYQDFLIQPFKVWTEFVETNQQDQQRGTVNFLPGMGAYLQSIIFGFVGIRIRPEMLEFHDPMPPPSSSIVRMKGFNYLRSNLTITVYESPRKVEIEVIEIHSEYPLVLVKNHTWGQGEEESMNPGETITINDAQQGFYIYTTTYTSCEHPRDYIYMPWGYSPWIDSASHINPSIKLVFMVLSTVYLLKYLS